MSLRIFLAIGAGILLSVAPAGPALAVDAHLTHAQATAQFRAAGITWTSSGNCTYRTRPSCTSFEKIRAETVRGVRTLRSASRCPVNVTGGTETGHVAGTHSHWNGYKVDLSRNACLDLYITTRFTLLGVVSWGRRYRAASGNLYTDEGSHWDVVYLTCGCR